MLKQDALSLASELKETQGQIAETIALVEQKEREAVRLTGLAETQAEAGGGEDGRSRPAHDRRAGEVGGGRAGDRPGAVESETTRRSEATPRRGGDPPGEARRPPKRPASRISPPSVGLRATLSDSGEYAAWKELQQIDPEVAATGANDPEWSYLLNAVNWRDEATELVAEDAGRFRATDPPRHFTADGARLVTATALADGQRCALDR